MSGPRSEHERGAALLEIIIALAITAMLAGAAGGVVRLGLTTLERAGDAAARGGAGLVLRRDLALMLTRIDAAPFGQQAAIGGPEWFSWRGVTPGPDGAWRGGFWRLSRDELALERCESLEGPCAPDGEPRAPGASARLSYAGPDGLWRADWPAGPAPDLIRVQLKGAEIIAAPRVRGASQ